MTGSGSVLTDTSVWIRFFRQADAPEAEHLDYLLEMRALVTCPPIRAEVLSGSRNERERSSLRELFSVVPCLALPEDAWERVEEARYKLARKGCQASLIDLLIACVSERHRAPLWTLDEDFSFIGSAIHFPRYYPEK